MFCCREHPSAHHRNNDRVNLHSVVPHPYSFLRFKSFQEDCCARVLHPGYSVGIPCQVSLLSGQQLVSAIQRSEHVLRSWRAQCGSRSREVSCKSCDYVRTTSQSQPKSHGEEEDKRRNDQGCYYDIINNRKTGVTMLLQGIYTNYHVLPMRHPVGHLHNQSPSVT